MYALVIFTLTDETLNASVTLYQPWNSGYKSFHFSKVYPKKDRQFFMSNLNRIKTVYFSGQTMNPTNGLRDKAFQLLRRPIYRRELPSNTNPNIIIIITNYRNQISKDFKAAVEFFKWKFSNSKCFLRCPYLLPKKQCHLGCLKIKSKFLML